MPWAWRTSCWHWQPSRSGGRNQRCQSWRRKSCPGWCWRNRHQQWSVGSRHRQSRRQRSRDRWGRRSVRLICSDDSWTEWRWPTLHRGRRRWKGSGCRSASGGCSCCSHWRSSWACRGEESIDDEMHRLAFNSSQTIQPVLRRSLGVHCPGRARWCLTRVMISMKRQKAKNTANNMVWAQLVMRLSSRCSKRRKDEWRSERDWMRTWQQVRIRL